MARQPPNLWDFINSFDPDRSAGPGRGVDRNGSPPPFPANFAAGGFFPFGGGGPREGGPRPAGPPGAWPWGADGSGGPDFYQWNPWTHQHGPWAPRHRGGGGGEGRHPHRRNEGEPAASDRQQDSAAQPPEQQEKPATGNDHPISNKSDASDSDTMRDEGANAGNASAPVPDPAEVTPEDSDEPHCPRRGRRCGGRSHHHGRGGPHARGGHRHQHHHHHPYGPPPFAGFDLSALIRSLGEHPLVQQLTDQFPDMVAAMNNPNNNNSTNNNDRSTTGPSNGENSDIATFSPPVDVFNTESSYILHVALPGARKEDVGLNWDPESRSLHVAGVVHRPGDEALLATLQNGGERTVGMFERRVTLPGNDEVDGMGISARMEDGILIVTAPKVEKEWTEIHKVDIE